MLSEFLKANIQSQASFVEWGYGQVEPNHLSAQRTGQIYAQLPAASEIEVLEQGQFVKYDYAKGLVNFEGAGEWMLVYNEIKLYREHQDDCEFAMIKDNYNARIYSPFGTEGTVKQARFYNGQNGAEDVTAKPDMYELHYNENPFTFVGEYKEAAMPANTTMVPRVFKTNVGDIFTTNTINAEELTAGQTLTPGATGILEVTTSKEGMLWQVAKVYTMPDHQKAAKLVRIQ